MNKETQIQIKIAAYLDKLNVLYNASCAGMKSSVRQGALHKRMGAKAGFPDLSIFEPRGGYHGLFIEAKAAKGKSTEAQEKWSGELSKRGYYAVICPKYKTDYECFDWAIDVINQYLNQKEYHVANKM